MIKYSNKIKLNLDCDVLDKTQDDFEILDYYPQLKLIRTGEYYAKNITIIIFVIIMLLKLFIWTK